MKTFMENPANVERKWFLVDADSMPLGRLASQVADILSGKNNEVGNHLNNVIMCTVIQVWRLLVLLITNRVLFVRCGVFLLSESG